MSIPSIANMLDTLFLPFIHAITDEAINSNVDNGPKITNRSILTNP